MTIDFSSALILVTGYSGFLGSHLIDVLLEKGAEVVGLQLRPEKKERGPGTIDRHPDFFYQRAGESPGDIFTEKCSGKKITACFHFAGNASAAGCQQNPRLAYEDNVLLTLQVLDYCRLAGIKKFIYPSTGYVYGNCLEKPAIETNRLISTNIYTATKIAAETLIESYGHCHGFDCRIGRVSNVYGKESSYETVTGNIIMSALKRNSIVLNTLKPVRDFIFIDDVIGGFLAFLENEKNQGCTYYNISTGIATSIQTLAETACELANLSKDIIVTKNREQFSDTKLVLDSTKLRSELNWEPRFTIKEGLSKILNGA